MRRRDPRPGRRVPAAALLVVVLFAHAAVASAAPRIRVDVGVVVASNEGGTTDPALSSLKSTLHSMFTYSSYRMIDRLKRFLSMGETGTIPLPENRSMRVTPVPARGDRIRLAVQIMEGNRNLLTTTLGLTRGGMVLVGGPPYGKGVMILIISAQ